MAVEGALKCMKYILIIFNLIFFICGAVCLGIGIWILVDKDKLMELAKLNSTEYDVPSLLEKGAYVLLGGGGFMFIVGTLGCLGACKENRCMLIMYGVLVLMVFTIELVAGILAVVYQGKIESELKTYLKEMISKQYEGRFNSSYPFSLAMDFVQIEYECCGIDNDTDYSGANAPKWVSGGDVPFTCCKFVDKSKYPENTKDLVTIGACPTTATTNDAWLNKGCYDTVRQLLEDNAIIVIGVGIGVAVIELLGVIFAFCMSSQLRDQNKIY